MVKLRRHFYSKTLEFHRKILRPSRELAKWRSLQQLHCTITQMSNKVWSPNLNPESRKCANVRLNMTQRNVHSPLSIVSYQAKSSWISCRKSQSINHPPNSETWIMLAVETAVNPGIATNSIDNFFKFETLEKPPLIRICP